MDSCELESTDWKGGWYKATVNSYCNETDMLTLPYASEPGIPYEEELLPLLSNNNGVAGGLLVKALDCMRIERSRVPVPLAAEISFSSAWVHSALPQKIE